MTRPEASLQTYVTRLAKRKGCLVLRLRPPPAGVPDLLLIAPDGRVVFLELKSRRGRLRAAQQQFILKLPLACHYKVERLRLGFAAWLDAWLP